jgi:hypothetical protein
MRQTRPFHGADARHFSRGDGPVFDRWFNKPAARLPQDQRATDLLPREAGDLSDSLLSLLDTQAQTDEAGRIAYRYLSLGHSRKDIQNQLGHILLREDAEFHSFQMVEAAFAQVEELDEARARMTIVALSRYLAAHAPTARSLQQTANLAMRLHRGEDLSAEDPDEEVV